MTMTSLSGRHETMNAKGSAFIALIIGIAALGVIVWYLTVPASHAQEVTGNNAQLPGVMLGESRKLVDTSLYAKNATGEQPTITAAPPTHAAAVQMMNPSVQAFFDAYCIRCHGPEKEKGHLRVDRLSPAVDNVDDAQRWQDILDALNAGDMPPKDEKKPTNAELTQILSALTDNLFIARKQLAGTGKVVLRRLSAREYAGNIRRLFGFEVDDVPADLDIKPFDSIGSEQIMTDTMVQKYLDLGRRIVRTGFAWTPVRLPSTVERVEAEVAANKNNENFLAKMGTDPEKHPEGSKVRGQISKRMAYLSDPLAKSGAFFCDMMLRVIVNRVNADPRATYRVRVRMGVTDKMVDLMRFVRVYTPDRALGRADQALYVAGTVEEPQISEFEIRPPFDSNKQRWSAEIRLDIYGKPSVGLSALAGSMKRSPSSTEGATFFKWNEQGKIWIDYVEVEGPNYPAERSVFDKIIYPIAPIERSKDAKEKAEFIWNATNARELINNFTYEAFRHRRPAKEYIDGLEEFFQQRYATNGKNFTESMSDTLAIVLASPGFLYLQELDPAAHDNKITDRELAIRLSHFLWSGPPDDELYQAAESGRLHDAGILRQQVERMCTDAKISAFSSGFVPQWADLARFDGIAIDVARYAAFSSGTRIAARKEVIEYFAYLITHNLPIRTLIDSDFVVINRQLATFYNIPAPASISDKFVMVKLPPGSPRGGLMTQAVFSLMGSNGERTSPVIRGALVMDKLLHSPPATPPPNVPELGTGITEPTPNHVLLALHRAQPQCASCHNKMDPIGLGLECFDAIGRYRAHERVDNKDIPIESAGTLPDGQQFTDVRGLRAALMKHERDLARGMIEAVLAFALGRHVGFADQDAIEEMLGKLRPDGYRMGDLIRVVATSPILQSP